MGLIFILVTDGIVMSKQTATTNKQKVMKIEFLLNRLEGDWWFDLGISCQKTDFHPNKKMVFTIALGFATVYIRW
jgi:hypothetical protein